MEALRVAAAAQGGGVMRQLRIGFLVASNFPQSTSHLPAVMRVLSDSGVAVDIVHPLQHMLQLSDVKVDHDLYLLKKTSRLALSLAGALHALGAAIVNPFPVTVALRDKIITSRILQSAGVPTPESYVAAHPGDLAPLLDSGPLVVKPYQGSDGLGVRVVRSAVELAAIRTGKEPVFAQRYHPPRGRDRKLYAIGDQFFGVKKVFPARTEADRIGEPFTPTPELCDIARRCGRAFGIDFYSVDIIESHGKPYVVDMCSIPGCGGVPDAPVHLATYLYAVAERASQGWLPAEAVPVLGRG
jgi:glutathione synthase/RimK-type ligase-like ATP-grasp enzyme